ncbi:hypothetical protein Glove_606g124 [Diversispora epigaea]|uniref:Uncharacterized protein n=1 Tax=Diversispora epigaea TaxID=1348612 RepID=A0A397G704_9GLOM|nr:hypothetical protein Glove_606g124 [Diversispora epigaea]
MTMVNIPKLVVSRSIQVEISTACSSEMIVEKGSFSSSVQGGNSVTMTDLAGKTLDFTVRSGISICCYLLKVGC